MAKRLTTSTYVAILEQRVAAMIVEVLTLQGEIERLKRELREEREHDGSDWR